ncbi:conserved hypothetical protein [Trichinella spiralis]|uniref:hypothetical protein n=1 Tax=Trichinella spiralis TaxID=6334 RepID=UPI0001EFD818|nr:conserved hypothetical protein [Trichinella spiralis]
MGINRSETICDAPHRHPRRYRLRSYRDIRQKARSSTICILPELLNTGEGKRHTNHFHDHSIWYRIIDCLECPLHIFKRQGRIAIIFIEGNVHFREKLEKRSLGNIQTVYNPVLELEPSCLQDFLQM